MASGKKNYFRHYLYIIGDDPDKTMGTYSGYIKIGITNSPKNRFKALQCSTPRKLKIITVIGFRSKFEAVLLKLVFINFWSFTSKLESGSSSISIQKNGLKG